MKKFKVNLLCTAILLATSATAVANQDIASLQKQIDGLKKEIVAGNNNFHMAGYATVQYQSVENGDDGFNKTAFAPIFMYQMNDMLSFEAELEVSVGALGETDIAMEYAYANIELTDNLTLIAGKYFIPVGTFVQNIHPSWINKAISMPVGFGHGGAAPFTEVGVQLRGGTYFGEMPVNYAVSYGNGSTVTEGHGGLEVENEGMTKDWSGSGNISGRVGFLPMPNLEIGFSFLSGKAALVEEYSDDHGSGTRATQNIDLSVFGADFVYRRGGLVVRGEFINQELDDFSVHIEEEEEGHAPLPLFEPGEGGAESVLSYTGNDWTTWYVQGAYRFKQTNWEGVVRWADFDSQIPGSDKEQLTLGVNYYFAPSVIVKVNFETIDSEISANDTDKVLIQLAYGF